MTEITEKDIIATKEVVRLYRNGDSIDNRRLNIALKVLPVVIEVLQAEERHRLSWNDFRQVYDGLADFRYWRDKK